MRIFFWVDCCSSAVAVVGTLVGAGGLGAVAGNPGIGVAIGAGAGLLGNDMRGERGLSHRLGGLAAAPPPPPGAPATPPPPGPPAPS